jgi:hypothetical protein
MICLVLVICVLLSCESGTVNNPDRNDFQYVGSGFQFDITDERPLAQLSGDTLVITDYWAIPEQDPYMMLITDLTDDSILISYESVRPDTSSPFVPSAPIDWSPSVKSIVKILARTLTNKIKLKIDSTSLARAPLSSEKELGVRNACYPLIVTIDPGTL